jgi:hypothetical protein
MKNKIIAASMIMLFAPLLSMGQSKIGKKPMMGSDRDPHGCIPSAGYTWSAIKKDCIKTFEQDIRLEELNPKKDYTSQVAVILSDDKKKAEVFLPGKRGGTILNYNAKTKTWGNGMVVLSHNDRYEIKQGKTVTFAEKK